MRTISGLRLVGGLSSALVLSCGGDDSGGKGGGGGSAGGGLDGGSGSGGAAGTGGAAGSSGAAGSGGGAGAGGAAGSGGSGGPSCNDGMRNGDETDVDCGGSCGGCEPGATCEVAGDCNSGHCVGGVCCDSACEGACETCNNVGGEGQCSPVATGSDPKNACSQGAGAETCDGASQCHCSNGVADADEELLDCGGTECDSCWHYFVGYTAAEGRELWRTDGTDAGTSLVKDINPAGDGFLSYSTSFVWMAGDVYFVASNGTAGRELWKTDGTDVGTVMVKDIDPVDESRPEQLTVYGGALFFAADDGAVGRELWKTDGTEAGTVMVKDIFPDAQSSYPEGFAQFNGQLYFAAEDGASGDVGNQLWKTDGTEAGTVRITNVTESYIHSNPTVGKIDHAFSPEDLTPSGNQLYFSAWKKSTGRELWVSDGNSGASQLRSFYSGDTDGFHNMIAYQDGLLVSATGGQPGDYSRLWGYDAGTFEELGYFTSEPELLTPLGGDVLFVGTGQTGGNELWRSDGTVAGTQIVKDIAAGDASSSPQNLLVHGDTLYFHAQSGTRGIWKTDGSESGTLHVADMSFGGPASFRNLVLFRSGTGSACRLWKTDGTPSGTVVVTDKASCGN